MVDRQKVCTQQPYTHMFPLFSTESTVALISTESTVALISKQSTSARSYDSSCMGQQYFQLLILVSTSPLLLLGEWRSELLQSIEL